MRYHVIVEMQDGVPTGIWRCQISPRSFVVCTGDTVWVLQEKGDVKECPHFTSAHAYQARGDGPHASWTESHEAWVSIYCGQHCVMGL